MQETDSKLFEANSQIRALTDQCAEVANSNLATEHTIKTKLNETLQQKNRLETELKNKSDLADRKMKELAKVKEELEMLKKNSKEELIG